MGVRNERRIGRRLLPFLIIVPILLGLAITVYYLRAEAAASRSQALRDRVIWDARDLAALIQPTIDQTRQLAGLVNQARAAGTDRDIIKGLAIPTLDLRREFLGVGVVFEPNGFDGRDADYEAAFPENDAHGRFAAYYYRRSGKPAATALLEMAELGNTQDWYETPLKTGRAALLVPYPYTSDGIDISLSSVAVPMHDAGKAVGVTLIDFGMADIAAKVQALKSTAISGAWIISADGRWVVHPDKAKIGQTLALYDAGPEGDIEALRRHGGGAKTGPRQTREGLNGATYLMVPIPFEGVEQSWFLAVSMPRAGFWDGMPKDATKIMGAAIAILFVASMIVLEFWLSARRGKMSVPKSTQGARAMRSGPIPRNPKVKPPLTPRRHEPTVRRR